MTTFGSTTEDHDGVPINRGPPEEDRKTEAELRGQMKDIAKAKATMGELATFESMREEMAVLKSLVDDAMEQNNKLVALYSTMRGEFDQYKQQRVIELQSWLANGGSTTPEDNDGTHA